MTTNPTTCSTHEDLSADVPRWVPFTPATTRDEHDLEFR